MKIKLLKLEANVYSLTEDGDGPNNGFSGGMGPGAMNVGFSVAIPVVTSITVAPAVVLAVAVSVMLYVSADTCKVSRPNTITNPIIDITRRMRRERIIL